MSTTVPSRSVRGRWSRAARLTAGCAARVLVCASACVALFAVDGQVASLAGAPPTSAQAARPADTSERTLANGLRVIVREDHRAPVAVHIVMYRVGSVDETSGRTGIAHLLEHLMFKGTPSHPGGEFSRIVAAMGGSENAFTTSDHTAYFQRIPASQLETVMRLEADRMANLVFDPQEFSRELQVVLEERRLRVEDQPQGLLYENLMAQAFQAAPVRTPVIGWMGDLKALEPADAHDFYRTWYSPGNAIVVVAGDVDAEAVFALAGKIYGGVESRPVPRRKPQDEPAQRGTRRLVVRAPAQVPSVVLAFKAPRLRALDGPADPFALAMLSAVLDGDENGRLTRELVRGEQLASAVDASWSFLGRGPGLFTLSATPVQGGDLHELESRLREQIARIARDGVSESELQRIRTQYLASQIYQRDSVFGRAMEILGLESAGVPWSAMDKILERVQAVTSADLQAVAGRYFDDDNLTVARLEPQQPGEAAPASAGEINPDGGQTP